MVFGAALALALAPGPDNLYVLALSASRGYAAGLIVTLGLCTGLLIHTSVAALGIAIILQTSALAYDMLQIVGAAYLLYLAWQAFRAAAPGLQAPGVQPPGYLQLYRRGIIMNVTNPKVAMFFLAFLPQFTNPALGQPRLQLALLGLVFITAALLVFSTIALLADRLTARYQSSPAVQCRLQQLTGLILCALALRLLILDP